MMESTEQQVDLREYLRVTLKHRWTLITVFFVILITVTIHSFTATPIYESTTRIIIDKENPNVVSFDEVMAVDASGTDYYQTQYKIIESRTVARDVIKRLNLAKSEEFFPKPKGDFISSMKRSIGETVSFWIDSIESLLKKETAVSDGNAENDSDYKLVSEFIERMEVKPIRNSRLVDVGFRARDPRLAARIANTIGKAYIDQNLETKLKAAQDAVRWLHSRIEDERKKVGKAEQALIKYKEKHNIITDFSSDVENVTAQKLAQLNTQVVEAESERVEAETRYKQAMAMTGTPDMLDSVPEVLNNELIRQIKSMEVELYNRMSELSKKYGRKHPRMTAIDSELKTIQKRKAQEVNRVVNSLRNEYRVALAKENSLKAALNRQKKETLELNQKAIGYGVLQREAESARQMYELLINRFKETSLTEDMKTGNIRIIDRAEVSNLPVSPRKKLNIILASIIGLIAGLGLTFFLEFLDNTIKVPDDIKRELDIPYLGPVPAMASNRPDTQDGGERPELVTLHSPKSTISEAFRGVRTSIIFSSAEIEPRIILISSSGPQEGKTLTASNLAITMANAGSRVVILDCDLRRPKIHKLFNIKRDKGMTNFLTGNEDIKGLICNTGIENLDVIPCGPVPPNPSEILGSARMSKLLEILKKNYTRIIIDSPPITAVTDAVVLSKVADGVVLVIRAGETPKEIIKNGLMQLRAVNAHVIGTILNGVGMGRDGYYYQYYYYYYGEDEKRGRKSGRRKK